MSNSCRRFAASRPRFFPALAWLCLTLPALVAGMTPSASAQEPSLYAYTFRHQPAGDAVALIQPLLSPRGTVELQPGGNTLIVRDTPGVIQKATSVLRDYDHPVRPLELEIFVVRATRAVVSPPVQQSDLPPELTRRLRGLLPYAIYEKVAQADLSTVEGQAISYDLGPDYHVSFRVGTVIGNGRVRLSDFKILKGRNKTNPLLFTHLNLWLDQTMSLGLARSESSAQALMVVLTVRDRRGASGSANRRREH